MVKLEEEQQVVDDDELSNASEGTGDELVDSSEEDEDEDDDEEAIKKVHEGFIVDDEDEEEEEVESHKKRKKHRRKRNRDKGDGEGSRANDDDQLDEDDLELLLENSGARPSTSKFKRLKHRSRSREDTVSREGRLPDIFSDDEELEEEEEQELEARGVSRGEADRNILDEFEDFIEEDEFSDEDEEARQQRKLKERQRVQKRGPRLDTSKLSNVDRESLQQLFEVFGNGGEYEWALEAQDMEDAGAGDQQEPTSLDEVFEHSELKERMLTEEDNLIRIIDIPERYQKYRANLQYASLEDDDLQQEKNWVANILFREKQGMFNGLLEIPFKEAVGQVVHFITKDSLEVPFIWTHRRDFLLFSQEMVNAEGVIENKVHKLLYEDDLWRIVQLDVEYHSLYEKRMNTEKIVEALGLDDDLVKDITSLDTMVAVQDIHDYIQFTYSKEIRELANTDKNREEGEEASGEEQGEEVTSETKSKKHSKYALFERIRSNILYDAVKAYGISAKEFGENVQDQSSKGFEVPYRIHATDDSLESPQDLIDRLIEDDEILFKDENTARDAIRRTFAEEIFHNPKIRHEVRQTYKSFASISIAITEKGRTTIDMNSPYEDIKYAINRSPSDLVRQPDLLLRMLEAESLGLVVVKVETKDYDSWFQCIFNCLKSDGSSDISDRWNKEREVVLQLAFKKLCSMVALNTKEDLRRECERLIAGEVRRRFLTRVDQAPYTPYGFDRGTKPNVLALTFGKGEFDSAVVGVLIKESGKVDEFFKSERNPMRDRQNEEEFQGELKEYFDRNLKYVKPDVIVISGYNANSKKLYDCIKNFVETNRITCNVDDLPTSIAAPPLLNVIWGQDETARLYQNSARAKQEFPDKPTLIKYAIGLARYTQNPLLEYVSLGDDILSLNFYQHQKLISNDLIKEALESVFVDIVNMVGVEINEAVRDNYIAQLLPYVCGLGPRKASGLIRNINSKLGSTLVNRNDLVLGELTGAIIFNNCSSFLNIPFNEGSTIRDISVELLDATRIHPEDYDLARKMAADALDLDEEDTTAMEENGGIILQLMQEGVNKVDELNLIAYGKELETKFGRKKYATLQMIKEELVNNFEELRRSFKVLDSIEVFQMLTGETPDTFGKNVVVPLTVTKVGKSFQNYDQSQTRIRFIKGVTSSMVQCNIEEEKIPKGTNIEQGQVIQAVTIDVFYESFSANLSLLPDEIKRASMSRVVKEGGKWDFQAEEEDINREKARENAKLAKTRNVQHPLYKNFNYKQAEEYLAPQNVGDCVIRPSSKGPQFLTITWKVANNLFQHLLIEEKNQGRFKEYVVEGFKYADLDQLVFQHIQAIAKKVEDMVRHPKFREGALTEVNEWLESYTRANPKSSAYVFCYDHKLPGSFLLLFKVNVNTPISTWHVRTEREGYTLKGFSYPNMLRLCNGFKQTFKSYVSQGGAGGARSRPPPQQSYNYGY
ncbi:transcription elongation factor SPT6 [Spathaspora passalidarum NRRL Y-27907]|uniref:Transcription elongation factor Spt6 n=1 Tax=Spathaspora passalidarum (strain NRRL Y-27907 / 11-Y1) TaxID=619300 RepID=G3AVK6_SPAPN|nr:transcription elongation factor SPT6 [Spathaspora passalidarum NRRL Y-27907]EGW29955.1 transcription elongation factor SPT6 [Spathaspora passalidarum NRRL Y-27907]